MPQSEGLCTIVQICEKLCTIVQSCAELWELCRLCSRLLLCDLAHGGKQAVCEYFSNRDCASGTKRWFCVNCNEAIGVLVHNRLFHHCSLCLSQTTRVSSIPLILSPTFGCRLTFLLRHTGDSMMIQCIYIVYGAPSTITSNRT